jgi:hypothetical protein
MLCLEDLSEDELKKVKATFASLAAAPEAARQIRQSRERLEDAGEALHGVAAELHRETRKPIRQLKKRSMADDRSIRGAADRRL